MLKSQLSVLPRRLCCAVLLPPTLPLRNVACCSGKGFGTETDASAPRADKASTSGSQEDSSVEALESRIRGGRSRRRQGKIEPQVKVKSAVVDAVSGKTPATAASQAETAVVLGLFYFFFVVLIEGLALAGAGFLPEDWDQWIQDKLYPSYSPTVLLFLACSSLYGLFKVGKLPGQKQL